MLFYKINLSYYKISMSGIVKIQITPVKNILVNPLYYNSNKENFTSSYKINEYFDPNEYLPEQVDKLIKKGYDISTLNSASETEISQTKLQQNEPNFEELLRILSPEIKNSKDTENIIKNLVIPNLKIFAESVGLNIAVLLLLENLALNLDKNPTVQTLNECKEKVQTIFNLYNDVKKTNSKDSNKKLEEYMSKLNIETQQLTASKPLSNLASPLDTDVIQNKNFAQSLPTSTKISNLLNINSQVTPPDLTKVAINQKLQEADKKYADLTTQVSLSNKDIIDNLHKDYENKIKSWTDNYQKSIKYYKEYINNQDRKLKELENHNVFLQEAMDKNNRKLDKLSKNWSQIQDKITTLEKQLLQSDNKKYNEVIKQLKQDLEDEKKKQNSIDSKLSMLRIEKMRLDKAFEENLQKLKMAGLGNNCPKDFNRNDYILKKNIPCWGCNL